MEIQTDFLPIINANAERTYYNRHAELQRRNAKAERKDTVLFVIAIVCFAILFMYIANAFLHSDYTYAVACENNNGLHYEYVTDRECTVTEICGEEVTVETRSGDIYSFYGSGYEVNDNIVCTFNSADELINTK